MNDQLQAALARLADKLGTTAEHLWGVLIRQARVEIFTCFMELFLAAFLVAAVCGYWRWVVKSERDWTDSFFEMFGSIIASLAAGIFFIGSIVDAFQIPTLLLNPEYWALQHILGAIK